MPDRLTFDSARGKERVEPTPGRTGFSTCAGGGCRGMGPPNRQGGGRVTMTGVPLVTFADVPAAGIQSGGGEALRAWTVKESLIVKIPVDVP